MKQTPSRATSFNTAFSGRQRFPTNSAFRQNTSSGGILMQYHYPAAVVVYAFNHQPGGFEIFVSFHWPSLLANAMHDAQYTVVKTA
jgi:hypothetical protein